MKITKGQLRRIIREELQRVAECPTHWEREYMAAQEMADEEYGERNVKRMKDYEDGVHTGVASLVDVIEADYDDM